MAAIGLAPLQTLSLISECYQGKFRPNQPNDWWSQTGSNRRPQACKASALPTELRPRPWLVGQGGLEPPTPRLSSVCSNQLSYWPRSCGVAQSGEGCAVGARRGSHHDQARRQGRYVSNNQETSVRGCPPSRSHPEPFGQARTKRS